MDPDTATKLLDEAKEVEKQITAKDNKIAQLKEDLKDAKERRECFVDDLRHLVKRDTPLLDATE